MLLDAYPTSFENRFKIRPEGFVSKKRIVAEMAPVNIELCNFCEARTQIAKKLTDLRNKRMQQFIKMIVK